MQSMAALSRYAWLSVWLLALWAAVGHTAVSVNLPLDDPAYPLLEKLVSTGLTFRNALTTKPITRIYAARLIAEAIQSRRQEWSATQRQDLFIDQTLQYLAGRFKQELRQIGFFYQPLRPGPFTLALPDELKLDMYGAYNAFIHRDSSGLTNNLQGVFELNEGFVPGDDFSMRLRASSWATLWRHLAVYVEPEFIVRSDPILGDSFDANLYKGYLKADVANLELAVGRDTLWWGPANQGALILSNNAPPLELVKLSTPLPFRLPWIYSELGEWQVAYIVAYLGDAPPIPNPFLSALRITLQPAAFLQFGFTNAFEAYGEGGVSVDALEFIPKNFVPSLDATTHSINGLVAYDIVLSLPWVRQYTFLQGVKFYWQRGQDNVKNIHGVLGGGNILGGVIDGGRWDLRVEYAETRDDGAVWYTHPTYQYGFAFEQFFLGHPIGGAAESIFARATYYLTPTMWVAADGRREQYGFAVPPAIPSHVTTQQRVGLEGSYELVIQQQHLVLWGRLEYSTLDLPAAGTEHAFLVHLSARWRL
jgi:hypothetical protein